MNIKKYLKEAVEDLIKRENDSVFIYSFPLANDERRDLVRSNKHGHPYRFIADSKTKKVYIFNPSILHMQVDRALKLNEYQKYNKDRPVIYGSVSNDFNIYKDLNPFFADDERNLDEYIKAVKKTDWSFLTKYIKGIQDAIVYWEKELKQ